MISCLSDAKVVDGFNLDIVQNILIAANLTRNLIRTLFSFASRLPEKNLKLIFSTLCGLSP